MSSLLAAGVTSCDDYLDMEPENKVVPSKFLTSEADLSAYTIKLYQFASTQPGHYSIGVLGDDNATDNQAAKDASNRWIPGQWRVSENKAWNFEQIRHCNYFLENVLANKEAGKIVGNPEAVNHYIGEAYVLRAYAYFDKLQTIGDCPIMDRTYPDVESELVEISKRRPRHLVARFILSDLDKALDLLMEKSPAGKNRISKNVAQLLRARVALFEGTWEKYHAGTAFVPGGQGWPGKDAEGYDPAKEIDFFLTEAMKSAKIVGDQMKDKLAKNTGTDEGMNAALASINPYYTMFCDVDLEPYDEVLMWRAFSLSQGVTTNIQMQLCRNAGGTGWTRGLVNSFLMKNGLPIYDKESGYNADWEKEGVNATLKYRDSRINIFTKKDSLSVDYYVGEEPSYYSIKWLLEGDGETRAVTGFPAKKGKHYSEDMALLHNHGESGSVVFRGAEALLIYMEASYEKNHRIDETADAYWKALRRRALIDENYEKTINATVMAEEAKGDFGAYSKGQLVDETLYNIRRERRNELIGEGMRWADLTRWRACDQVKNYQIEGIRYWGSAYETLLSKICVIDTEGTTGNMSDKSISGDYVRPYQITRHNNLAFDGYNFTPAHYLTPLAQSVFHDTAAGDKTDLESSVVYQNPGWGKINGEGAKK